MADEAPVEDGVHEPHPWTWALGFGWLLPLMLFVAGHDQIDQAEPNISGGFALYLFSLITGLAVVAVAFTFRRDVPWWPFSVGGFLALPTAYFIAIPAQDLYNDWGLGFYFFYLFSPIALSIVLVSLLVMGLTQRGEGVRNTTWMWGLALSGGFALSALYHLATIQRQADLAREAHESPLGLVAIVAALAVLAWTRRHSR